jgi:hypothetical protein
LKYRAPVNFADGCAGFAPRHLSLLYCPREVLLTSSTDFVFAAKVPQVITHDKVLVGCEPEWDEFIERTSLLGAKLGPMLFQFPKFDKRCL